MSVQYKILLIATCCMIFSLLSGIYSAQPSSSLDESCFPYKTLHTISPVDIRDDREYRARWVGKTVAWQAYSIYETSRVVSSGSCWIKISTGWVLRVVNSNTIRPGSPNRPSNTRTITTSNIGSGCYTSADAYITGNMNIRSGPSTGHSKTGLALAGESHPVSKSEQGNSYCWLKIAKGWIAKTGRVSATKQIAYTPSATNMTDLPSVEGGELFRAKISKAWNYLRDKSSKWFSYVVSANFSLIQESWRTGISTSSRRLEIVDTRSYTGDIVVLSSIFIHEACHVYQWNQGRWQDLSLRQRESECYQKQVEAVSQYAPGSQSYIDELRRYAENPPHLTVTGW